MLNSVVDLNFYFTLIVIENTSKIFLSPYKRRLNIEEILANKPMRG